VNIVSAVRVFVLGLASEILDSGGTFYRHWRSFLLVYFFRFFCLFGYACASRVNKPSSFQSTLNSPIVSYRISSRRRQWWEAVLWEHVLNLAFLSSAVVRRRSCKNHRESVQFHLRVIQSSRGLMVSLLTSVSDIHWHDDARSRKELLLCGCYGKRR